MLTDIVWRSRAACRQEAAEHFFAPARLERKPEKDIREGVARSLCNSCLVKTECLEYSLAVREPYGIWGGLNELERRRLLRRRNLI